MRLSEGLLNPMKKAVVVDDCCNMIESQLASKSGLGGIAIKTAFAALKGIKPGYIPEVVEALLPQCFDAIDPIWSEGVQKGDPVQHLVESRSRTADVLLSITDDIAKISKRQIVRSTYNKLRGSAKLHVEAAVPDFAKVIEKYTTS
ncbi:DUF6918 family protein [aff. Roholtiella sp. LEGE 12411]|uniref:DUF6918 family protein n=1 Tax=aff. Roholtiella sp. LEGE 12411 TaxID=1828822 RepID=UPI001882AECE|nr:hypothetical protein [aff. Roholtiella sp. LEGE 12411]MBE9036162.1 hypothetical protein [aff. Roholtiella sp. LEGE 12411]